MYAITHVVTNHTLRINAIIINEDINYSILTTQCSYMYGLNSILEDLMRIGKTKHNHSLQIIIF